MSDSDRSAAGAAKTPAPPPLPAWAEEMRRLFRAGSASQFLLHGNVVDLVEAPDPDADGPERARWVSLSTFLVDVMFAPFDVVLLYDRGRGIRVARGGDHFQRFLSAFDSFRGSSWSGLPEVSDDQALDLGGLLPRDPGRALELVDRFLRGAVLRTVAAEGGTRRPSPLRVGVVLDHASFLAPRADTIHLAGERAQTLIRLLDWARDPVLTSASVATVLISESLADIHDLLVETPYSAKIRIDLPDAAEIDRYAEHLIADDDREFEALCEVERDVLAEKLVGLSRVNVRSLLRRALTGGEPISRAYLTRVRKELIEAEARGRIEFVEPRRTLDAVAGHTEAKRWLRQDARLLARGHLAALPMGYLLCGRIGTGKTFLVECWAGEVGIPVVELRNFREKWVGASEGNLEHVFTLLEALGQVVVFIDEADQFTGRRGASSGDSGLSGRIYAMLAKKMSDTANRGKILWVFATSRPDLLEVDLKRQGRLDVHIPLFPPADRESRRALFAAMARKVGVGIPADELPDPPDDDEVGGNEMEGILVRALRRHATQEDDEPRRGLVEILEEVLADFRPSAHVERLRLMDLLAVKEATDSSFLPERFRRLSPAEVDRRIDQLRAWLGE